MSLEEIVAIFKEIQATTSRTSKEAILKANEGNVDFRRILEFIYNPFILTGIKGKKLQKFASYNAHHVQFFNVFEAINFIEKNNTGRDEDVKAIANYINNQTDTEVHDFLQDMFTKDFKCGITAGTINKVYGKGTIPEFDVMLAKSFKDHGHKLKGHFYITLKIDGIRCVAIKKDGAVQFFTRQGQPIDDLVDVEQEIVDLLPDNFVYDGELLLRNSNNVDSATLFRATQKVVRKDGVKQGLELHVFDGLPVDEFMEGKSKLGYEKRRKHLEEVFAIDLMFIDLLPVLYVGNDKNKISDLLTKVIADGHEGLMINTATGLYVTKRSDVLLKVKEMHTVDLKILGLEEGSGKYKNTLGAIIVDYKGYKVRVGSGFTDSERNMLWNTKDIKELSLIDKIAEIQYFEESSNEDGGISLRFPVFIRIRDDKDKPSLH